MIAVSSSPFGGMPRGHLEPSMKATKLLTVASNHATFNTFNTFNTACLGQFVLAKLKFPPVPPGGQQVSSRFIREVSGCSAFNKKARIIESAFDVFPNRLLRTRSYRIYPPRVPHCDRLRGSTNPHSHTVMIREWNRRGLAVPPVGSW
uniref:Uncharacterized protein n=1 Tax=Hyaloperonospora arabidopsidis (strain Emoy2) TaxID=559515 RepID=M4BBT3_HYAAE